MASTSMVHVRIDEATKTMAAETLSVMGLSISDAVRVFLKRVVDEKQLPFELKTPNTLSLEAMAETDAIIRNRRARSYSEHEQILISKTRVLPPERLMEVEDFIDFLRQANEDRQLRQAAAKLSEGAFAKVWDNEEDADYDRL